MENLSKIEKIRHSLAHLLGASVIKLYPGSKITLGPAIENGFYYDIDVNGKITDADLPKIEETMREILKTWNNLKKKFCRKKSLKFFAGNPYKKK
jgi:threonyl-tRNA synthetase